MPDGDDQNQHHGVSDVKQDAIVADPNAIGVGLPREFFCPARSRGARKVVDSDGDAPLHIDRQTPDLAGRRWGYFDAIGHRSLQAELVLQRLPRHRSLRRRFGPGRRH